jgi:hypothetical protein
MNRFLKYKGKWMMIRKKRDKRIMANRIEDKFPLANASDEQIKEYHSKRIADLSNLSKLKNMSDSEIQELTDLKEQLINNKDNGNGNYDPYNGNGEANKEQSTREQEDKELLEQKIGLLQMAILLTFQLI